MAQVPLQSVANNTFPAVRADLNAQLAALYSNNSGTTAPVNPVPYQMWADTTASLLKMRNAANSAWINIGPLETANLGLALASNGALSNPTVTGGTFSSPGLTGTPTCPTAAVDTDTTQIASTAFVQQAIPALQCSSTGTISVSGAQNTFTSINYQSPATLTTQKNKGFTLNSTTGLITIPSSGVYVFSSNAGMSFTTTTGFKDIVIYLGYTHNSNNLFIEASRIGWPNGVGDNTTFGIVLGGAIAFTSFFAAGDTVRPLYGGFCGGGYVTGFAPIDFGLARLG